MMSLFDEVEVHIYDFGRRTRKVTLDVLCGTTPTRIRRLVSRLVGTPIEWIKVDSVTWNSTHQNNHIVIEAW